MSDRTMETSDDEQFADALEEKIQSPAVPITRVEKTDAKPSHGEVPGTDAHDLRKQDAKPDEIEVIPESSVASNTPKPPSSPIPKTVIEKVDPSSPSHGEVPGTEAHSLRLADAEPDEVKKAPEDPYTSTTGLPASGDDEDDTTGDDDGAADDFDDFNEGEEADGDDDFGAFDEGDETGAVAEAQPQARQQQTLPPAESDTAHLPPLLNFEELDGAEDIANATAPYLEHLYPNINDDPGEKPGAPRSSFLNERSQSLWAQLVAPPPLQPPNWVKSRTRRLFLVSLGVPVDLDEILPASKQKKLVLPSIDIEHEREKAANGSVAKLKQKNNSSTSVNSTSSKPERRRKGQPAPPEFDDTTARRLCSMTKEALENLSPEELRAHNKQLEELKRKASAALEYWLIQRDSASGDKEAFEEVINNFVKHAKKLRT